MTGILGFEICPMGGPMLSDFDTSQLFCAGKHNFWQKMDTKMGFVTCYMLFGVLGMLQYLITMSEVSTSFCC